MVCEAIQWTNSQFQFPSPQIVSYQIAPLSLRRATGFPIPSMKMNPTYHRHGETPVTTREHLCWTVNNLLFLSATYMHCMFWKRTKWCYCEMLHDIEDAKIQWQLQVAMTINTTDYIIIQNVTYLKTFQICGDSLKRVKILQVNFLLIIMHTCRTSIHACLVSKWYLLHTTTYVWATVWRTHR